MDKAMAEGKTLDEFLQSMPEDIKPKYIVRTSKVFTYWEQLWDENNPDHLDKAISDEEMAHVLDMERSVAKMRKNGTMTQDEYVETNYPSLTESEVRGFLKMNGPERKQL